MRKAAPTPEEIAKRAETKRQRMEYRRQCEIPPASKAIRLHCIECSGGSFNEVKVCAIGKCALFPYRFGRNPKPSDLIVTEFDIYGNVTGTHNWQGYRQVDEIPTSPVASQKSSHRHKRKDQK